MEPVYDVDYFISFFEIIPKDKWCAGAFELDFGNRHCALGHCGERPSTMLNDGSLTINDTLMSRSLENLFGEHITMSVIQTNDGHNTCYPQPTPKQRILAALYDIKANQMLDSVKEDLNNANKTILCQEKKHFTEEESIKM